MDILKIGVLAGICLTMPIVSMASAHKSPAPDIMGVWELYPSPFKTDADVFKDLPVPNGGPDLKEPYAAQWKALRAKRAADLKAGTPLVDASTLCLPEGMPTIMGAIYPIQILQTPGQVTVLAEFLSQTRRIYLDTKMPKPDDIAPSYYGLSVGHWEGNTLVVKTRGIRKDVKFFEIPHSINMAVTERISLTAPGRLRDEIVIDDPRVLKKPYRVTFTYKRNDHYRIMEYICQRDPHLVINKDGTYHFQPDDQTKK